MAIIGGKIGRIRVESLLGRGGMGDVYVGYDETLQRQVALKSIQASHRQSPEARARFVREARVLSQLDHPNICKIHDFIEDEHRDYLVLELIEGRDLATAVGGGLDSSKKLPIARAIARALAAAHAEGIVHRDLKPENVMLTEAGEVKVLDFGLARPGEETSDSAPTADAPPSEAVDPEALTFIDGEDLEETLAFQADAPTLELPVSRDQSSTHDEIKTMLGAVMGTPGYMSPEQARGEQVTTTSDMYSFGLLLQVLFTGEGPYPKDSNREEIFRRAVDADTLPVTGLGADLTRLIESLKSAAPAARPTAMEAADRLRWIADRPKRRARWLAAAAVLAVLAVGALKYTFDLRRERQIADLRRGQAEDLIGFMLGDLREKLEPLGRLEILDDVGQQAIDYFASVPETELTDDELLSRSKALYQIGEVRFTQGDLPQAEEPFRQSLLLAEALSQRDPLDGERLFGVGQSHFWLGSVHWQQGEFEEAKAEFDAYLEVSERLVEIDPTNEAWQLEVGYALTNLAAIYERQGRLHKALDAVRRSNEIKRRLAVANPSDTARSRSLANGLSWLGLILRNLSRLEESRTAFREEIAIREGILETDPRNPASAYLLATSREHLGDICLAAGDLGCALENQQLAVDGLEQIIPLDESNTHWKRELAVAQRLLGDALLENGNAGEASTRFARARIILEQLLEADETNADWQNHLARSYHGLARVRLDRNESGVLQLIGSARSILGTLDLGDLQARRVLAESYLLEGQALERGGRPERARAAWKIALETLTAAPLSEQGPRAIDFRVQALLHLGREDEARPLFESLVGNGYARPTFLAICQERGLLSSSETES